MTEDNLTAILYKVDDIRLEQTPVPEPAEGQVDTVQLPSLTLILQCREGGVNLVIFFFFNVIKSSTFSLKCLKV